MHCRLTTLAFALLATLAATTVPAITMARPMTPTGELPRAATLTHAVSGGYLENHAAGVPRMTLVDDDNDKDNDDNDDYENDSTNEADLIDWNRFSLHRHSPNSATSATASIPPTIPRIVWTFWESEASMPAVVRACVENMRRLNQGWHVQLLTMANVRRFLSVPLPPNYADLSIPMFSDWLRLELLSARGGLWIDISSIALHGFDWIQQIQRDTPLAIDRSASTIDLAGHAGAPTYPEAILYQQRVWQQQSAYPLVESWFIATVPRGRFVSAWRDEFNAFLASGMKGGQYARHWGVDMQGMPGHLYDYLAVLVTAQKVMQVDGILAGDSAVVLDAEDGPFYHAYKVGWDTVAYAKLVGYQPFRLTGKEHLHFLKLNSALRKAIIDHVDPHTVPRQSIYGRYLLPQMPDVKRKDEEDEISPKRENPRGRSSSPHVRHHDKIPRIVSTTTVLDDGDEDSRDSTDTLLDMRVMSPTTVDRAVPARRR